MMLGSKKPKFKLELTFNELSNIPQVSGYCFLDIQIRDKKRVSSLPFRGLSLMNGSSGKTVENDTDSSKSSSSNSTSDVGSSSVLTGGNIDLITSKKKINKFKCNFNCQVACNLKFGLKRRENLIVDKYLIVKVYYINASVKESSLRHCTSKLELGKLEINLAEYLNFNEPITSKYLLKDSKVNSLLSVTIHLSELPSNFDFHTQLQITDNVSSHTSHKDKLSQGTNQSSTHYNVPQFEKRNVFGGLNDVLSSENKAATESETFKNEVSSSKSDDVKSKKPTSGNVTKLSESASSGNQSGKVIHNSSEQRLMVDPIINNLYKKILESTWDPKLHTLLDFTPEKCIESIFNDSSEEWQEKLKESLATELDDDDEVRCIHGLVNETCYREDLRSWNVNVN